MNNNTDKISIKSHNNLDIKLLDQKSIPLLYHLFYELDISLEKIRIYKAISKDALTDDKVVLTIAQEKGVLVGFNITIINRNRFWLFFAIFNKIKPYKIPT